MVSLKQAKCLPCVIYFIELFRYGLLQISSLVMFKFFYSLFLIVLNNLNTTAEIKVKGLSHNSHSLAAYIVATYKL